MIIIPLGNEYQNSYLNLILSSKSAFERVVKRASERSNERASGQTSERPATQMIHLLRLNFRLFLFWVAGPAVGEKESNRKGEKESRRERAKERKTEGTNEGRREGK